MYQITKKLIILFGVLLIVTISLGSFVQKTRAQSKPDQKKSTCLTCHEDLYYFFDTGKWYCLCQSEAKCTDCHLGNESTADKEKAHEGMITAPAAKSAEICQRCHPDDYEAHIEKFGSIAGFHKTPCPLPTTTATLPSFSLQQIKPNLPSGEAGSSSILRIIGTFMLIAAFGLFSYVIYLYKTSHI